MYTNNLMPSELLRRLVSSFDEMLAWHRNADGELVVQDSQEMTDAYATLSPIVDRLRDDIEIMECVEAFTTRRLPQKTLLEWVAGIADKYGVTVE